MQTHSILSRRARSHWRIKTVSISFAVLLGVANADLPPLPGWVEGRRDLFPPVSSEAINTMREAFPHSWGEDTILPDSDEIPLENARACKAIADLGDDAAVALIWVYAEDPPLDKILLPATHKAKAKILGHLYYDRQAGTRLAPLLRARLAWAKKQIIAGTLGKTWFSATELNRIAMTLNLHGTDEDFKNAMSLEEELKKLPGAIGEEARSFFSLPLEERLHDAELSKVVDQGVSHPYADGFRILVASRPDIYGKPASTEVPAGKSEHSATPPPSAQNPASDGGHGDADTGHTKSVVVRWIRWIAVSIFVFVCFLMWFRRIQASTQNGRNDDS
ncbi:MAG: hypothetical protein K1X78_28255 [Verrucomicrobiaceae bacterium]|nr:hypothetical protein [Verrucomicrobiaceae bacterium]